MHKKLRIGLFGFGVVGQGLYDIFTHTEGFNAEIVKICVKHPDKPRPLPAERFTFNPADILEDPTINLVVEMINHTGEAYEIAKTALQRGKTVVSASKKMLAENLEELVDLQHQHNVPLLYEAAVCGSIPIIRNLEEYYDNELLYSVSGIVNGTSNYILSKIFRENLDYATALRQAQDAGFAETDPTADVAGLDALNKLCLLVTHAYGIFVKPQDVFSYGIESLSAHDIQFAREKGLKIKLVAQTRKLTDDTVTAFVMPQFVRPGDYLYNVENEYNGVTVEAAFADKQFFMGKGAGGHPTGAAVLSDISACRYDYQYEYKKSAHHAGIHYATDATLEVYVRYENEDDLQLIGFDDITERFENHRFRYVIGSVSLRRLVEIKRRLTKRNLFLVHMEQKSLPAITKAEQSAQEHSVSETL
ncbi:MAG: homoserine dehydrogenase [Cytophagales bacterium]|jgi:homoserine dehydrogenase|nr:homoserine dehydrogenase [Cytophagales bacterium]